jgi:hypothetical protein
MVCKLSATRCSTNETRISSYPQVSRASHRGVDRDLRARELLVSNMACRFQHHVLILVRHIRAVFR